MNETLMNFVTDQLKLRMNNPSYIIQADDRLADLFGRGCDDLREFIDKFNRKLNEFNLPKLRFSKKITYRKVLTSFIENYEQIKIHESKTSNYSE